MQPKMVSITTMAMVIAIYVFAPGISAGDFPQPTSFLGGTIADLGAKTGPRFETFMDSARPVHSCIVGSTLEEMSRSVLGMKIEETSPGFMAGMTLPEYKKNVPAMLRSRYPVPDSPFAREGFGHDFWEKLKSRHQGGTPWDSGVTPADSTWVHIWANADRLGLMDASKSSGRDVLSKDDLLTPENVELEDTHWRLVELNGEPIDVWKGQRVPHMEFNSEENRVWGFAGCNRFFGGFSLEGEELAFGPMGMTRMACPSCYGGDLEQEFVTALGSTTNYTIRGNTLELHSGEELIARFEPASFPR